MRDLQRQDTASFFGGAMRFCWIVAWLGFAYRFDRGFWLRVVCVCLRHIHVPFAGIPAWYFFEISAVLQVDE